MSVYTLRIFFLLLVMAFTHAKAQQAGKTLYHSPAFNITADEVVQGKFRAKAVSAFELSSSYQSPANSFKSPQVSFKFSINGKDNEMLSGRDHLAYIAPVNGVFKMPLIKFGQQYVDKATPPANTYLAPGTAWQISLDMRDVLDAFKTTGYYTTFNGTKIYKDDFKAVYVAGSSSPLIWDFDNLVHHPGLQLKDEDGDGIYTLTLVLNRHEEQKTTALVWKLSKDISAFPQYHSDYLLADALYNMSLEEMQNAVEPDSTFRTGKEWAGVWTRDISYSIILSMAILQPKVAEYSLMRKVKNNRVIQDTGTGGSYPVSSDRMIWAVAAWEVYKVTGDSNWLKKAYAIIKNSADDDAKIVYDTETGLVKGESSFLDWREQTYPKWMQPADIYESECLGTSAVHYQTNVVLSDMAALLNDKAAAIKYASIAGNIKAGINKYLWMPEKGYYGQYLYGRKYKLLSPRSEALGEALAILFNIAGDDKCKQIVANTPVNAFGIPCIYPQIPNIPPYHNNAIWPFVQSYWTMAAAKAGNEAALAASISAIYRPAALFLTNKENFVASNGDFAGTQINSSNMLWSLSGSIGLVYKVLFGMDIKANSLVFKPFVPKVMAGIRTLKNFKYRNAILDITMQGYGNHIKTITIDGRPLANAEVSANLTGKHNIIIVLADIQPAGDKVNRQPDHITPAAPVVSYNGETLSWEKSPEATGYKVLRNGKLLAETKAVNYPAKATGEYQVIAVDTHGTASFASEPVDVYLFTATQYVQAEDFAGKASYPYQGFAGSGFSEISTTINTTIAIKFTVPQTGVYALDLRYANGNGPVNTENKCAIRTAAVDNKNIGTLVFPQRGKEEWSNWGFSNSKQVTLQKGNHVLTIKLEEADANMNGEVNQAMIDYLRITRIANK